MDMSLTKFMAILVLCEIINSVTGIPIKDSVNYVNSRYERSPSENFSLFGFGIKTPFSVPNPITIVRENSNNLANLFRPVPDLSHSGNNIRNQQLNTPQQRNEINKKDFIITKPDEVLAPNKGNATKNREPPLPPSIKNINKPEVLPVNIYHDKDNHVVDDNNDTKNNTKSLLEAVANKTEAEKELTLNTETTTILVTIKNEKKNNMETKIDQKYLDYIFNIENSLNNTIVDTTETGDYTTETGDYNSTTIDDYDDLLRIPGPVVASLLG